MCCVFGGVIPSVTMTDLTLIENLFRQAEVRGMHAAGISFWVRNRAATQEVSEVKSGLTSIIGAFHGSKQAANILSVIERAVEQKGGSVKTPHNVPLDLWFVAHCRYSTSNLLYNQPILGWGNSNHALVHNGVITQAEPPQWETLYPFLNSNNGYPSGNDSYLLWKAMELWVKDADSTNNPFTMFPDASMAAIDLQLDEFNNPTLRFFRNGKRPLKRTYIDYSGVGTNHHEERLIVCSTNDIIHRAYQQTVGSFNSRNSRMYSLGPVFDVGPGVMYTQRHNHNICETTILEGNIHDLQL